MVYVPFQPVKKEEVVLLNNKLTICCIFPVYDKQVKVWCTQQEASVLNIDMKANICCVKYNPGSSNHIAVCSFNIYFRHKYIVTSALLSISDNVQRIIYHA